MSPRAAPRGRGRSFNWPFQLLLLLADVPASTGIPPKASPIGANLLLPSDPLFFYFFFFSLLQPECVTRSITVRVSVQCSSLRGDCERARRAWKRQQKRCTSLEQRGATPSWSSSSLLQCLSPFPHSLPPTTLGSGILSAHSSSSSSSSSSSRSVPSIDVPLSLSLSQRGEGEMGDTSSAKRVSLTGRTTAAQLSNPPTQRNPRDRSLFHGNRDGACARPARRVGGNATLPSFVLLDPPSAVRVRPFRLFSPMFSFSLSSLCPPSLPSVAVDQACYVHVVPRARLAGRGRWAWAHMRPSSQQHQPLRIKHEPASTNGLSSQEETSGRQRRRRRRRRLCNGRGSWLNGSPRLHLRVFARSYF